MKRNSTLTLIGWLIATLGRYKSVAQNVTPPPPPQKETQEVIIRKKGDKDVKVTVEITGDKILLNGKPLAEFNEEGVTINNRKMVIRDGDHIMMDFDGKMGDLKERLEELKGMKNFSFDFNSDDMGPREGESFTFLGVNTDKTAEGVKITAVTEGSPADKAGLQKGDIIYKIEDKKIEGTDDLSKTIRAMKDGEKVKIYYLRDGKKKDVKATLAKRENMKVRGFISKSPDGSSKSFSIPPVPPMPPMPPGAPSFDDDMFGDNEMHMRMQRPKLGLKIQDREEGGIKVLEVESSSAAATAGLMKDDVITEIGGVKVQNTDEAREQLHLNGDKSTYSIKAKRNGNDMTFTIKIPKKLKTADL